MKARILHRVVFWSGLFLTAAVSMAHATVISNVSVGNIGSNVASIFWDTDVAASGEVDYGTTPAYGNVAAQPALAIFRRVDLSGLMSGTLYHFQVQSRDASGNLATDGDFTFTTSGSPGTCVPPVDCSPPFPGCHFEGGDTCQCGTLVCVQPPQPPAIMGDPQSVAVQPGQSASFSVIAVGDAPLTYLWQTQPSGAPAFSTIPGSNNSQFTMNNVQVSDNATQVRVMVVNGTGTVISGAATLTVISNAVAPAITQSPQSVTVAANQITTFTVTATGTQPLTYLWQISQAGTPTFSDWPFASGNTMLVTATPSSSGNRYRVVVSNVAGSATSLPATLTVGSACDLNADGTTNVVDVQREVNMALGVTPCTADINQDTVCNVVDIQRVVNNALGGPCVSP